MDSKFTDAIPNCNDITEIAGFNLQQSRANSQFCDPIVQRRKPIRQRLGAIITSVTKNLSHADYCSRQNSALSDGNQIALGWILYG